jgi:hypothetical protein
MVDSASPHGPVVTATCPSSSDGPNDFHLLAKVHCCREWEVSIFAPISACGLCGEVPD